MPDSETYSTNNPFRLPRRSTDRLCKVIRLLWPYLSKQDQVQCANINSMCRRAMSPAIWHHPTFHDGRLHDALHLFNRFIDLLPDLTFVRPFIYELDFSGIEESLYDRAHPYFFRHLVWFTPNLRKLTMRKVSFFGPHSLRGLPSDHSWRLSNLRELDLAYAEHITDHLLVTLATALPNLQRLRLDGINTDVDKGVAAFAYQSDQLRSISLRECAVQDTGLTALAKFRKIELKELDLAGCRKISTAGLAMVGKYNIKLHYLSLARTPCNAETLEGFRIGLANYLQYLDVSGCKLLDRESDRVARCLSGAKLVHLVISMAVAKALVRLNQEQLIPSVSSYPLAFLEVDGLPEHTPMVFLDQLIQVFPQVKQITLHREYYESDFMGGYLSGATAAAQEEITESAVEKFNHRQRVLVILANKREKIEDLGIHTW
ncbi:hypothetical protein EC973_007287 [Apophysomyces ossiformis]|uniref:RNI-like protein n=1 Tax=Apophysomyces ossiformis TaxID=679940 RepID=A0A8H7BPX7_9FUNG|nr:hypothetical protein EC973_007287 [Apophysomyces ossiformis]